ncbi:hypothetical protein BDQ17DRAFT_1511635 [Cyathus striatus]|nr:hypothetical protein BDQ17DRAFT_1511635 [Cyathus striatus]
MSSNQFQNARVFFYAIGMSDGPLRSYIIKFTKFPACLFGFDYLNEDSIITSQLHYAYCVMAFGNYGPTCERCKSRGNDESCLGDNCSIPEMDFLPVKSQRDYVKNILVLNKYRITPQIAQFQYMHYKAVQYVHYLIEIVIPSLVNHIHIVGSLESLQMNNIVDSDFNHNNFKKWVNNITSLL